MFLGRVLKTFNGSQCSRKEDECQEGVGILFIAGSNSAEALDSGEEPLNDIAHFVKELVDFPGGFAVASGWNNDDAAQFMDLVHDFLAVVTAVRQDILACQIKVFQKLFSRRCIMNVSWCQKQLSRYAVTIDQGMQLCPYSAP